jgi:hypothetical protein
MIFFASSSLHGIGVGASPCVRPRACNIVRREPGVRKMHCLRLNHLSSRQKAKKVAKKGKKEENPFKGIKKEKEDPQMNDTMFLQESEREAIRPGIIDILTRCVEECPAEERKKKKPGRPQQVI